MAEYIERDALIDDLDAAAKHGGMGAIIAQTLQRYVRRAPAADVVTPVRCGECRKFIRDTGLATGKDVGLCDGKMFGLVRLTDYCSFGELLCNGDKKD